MTGLPDKSIPGSAEIAAYAAAHCSPRDAALLAVESETAALGGVAVMQTAPDQAAMLELLVRLTGARRAIEVGSFTGYGAIRIARGLGEGGELICCESDERWAEVTRANVDRAGVGDRVEVRLGPALETLRALDPGFDFAYVDADKTGYPAYYEELLRLIVPGGLIALDNVLQGGRVLDPAGDDESARVLAALNDRIAADDRVEVVMLAIADGITLARIR